MAIQSSVVYHCMQKVFCMFEDGKLKGQKESTRKTVIGRKKALQGHFSVKAHQFKVFQGLQVPIISSRNIQRFSLTAG